MAAPTWYDVLGVERDASAEEVRAAWRAATDRAEPGSGQFRAANEAAETLLEPARRAAYDATLEAPAARATQPAATVLDEPAAEPAAEPTAEPADEPAAEPADEPAPTDEGQRSPGWFVRTLGRTPVLGLVALLVLVLALAGASVWLGREVSAEARVADARDQATVAAEQAAEAILSYDYEDLATDQKRAEGYLTGDFKQEFTKNFRLLSEQPDGSPGAAVQTKATVQAQAVGSGVVDVADDGRTARVLVFVNQTSEKQDQEPQVFLNRVSMTMQERDGRWLVSDVRSY
ncbi:DnaJ domain-containing protein [Nocardioides marmoraquaticus]